MRAFPFLAFLVAVVLWPGHLTAKEYIVPAGDVGRFFAELPDDATYVSFSEASTYTSNGDIVLPAVPLLVIDGKGSKLQLGPNSNGFTCQVPDQRAATARLSGRYVIRDFATIEGGRKAIDLQATLGSEVRDVKLLRQTEAGVDLRFCLMARLEHVFVTNPGKRGIVVRQGDWPGATGFNSQSNSTVLEQCRVYAAKTTTDAFQVLNSGGVRMTDCVSEGAPCDHDLFLSATTNGDESRPANNTVVKSFTLSNFHVEHAARLASIYVNMPSKAAVHLSNVYWNGPQTAPVILYTMGQLDLSEIGWWHESFRIATRISAPRITIERCHSALSMGPKDERNDRRAGALHLEGPLPGNAQLKLNYVVVRDKAM
ncbi:MAG: hypothetical protein H6597_06490 [Flavobacteriales bacterium]|nr:hypothetical protein [Flavobacteriales bacterium]MCB9194164.1 hypothetical protein [Flavobacteriales bacterium]